MSMFNRFSNFPKNHILILPSDTVDLPKGPMIVYAASDGTIEVLTANGVTLEYLVVAGDIIPVLVKRVKATNTTAECYGLY